MRVALVAMHFAEYSMLLARALAAKHDVLLLLNFDNFKQEVSSTAVLPDLPGLRVEFILQSRNPLEIARQAARMVWLVRRFRPDVIHLQETSKDALALALPFLRGAPRVLTVHDPTPHSGEDSRLRRRTRHGIYIAQMRRHAHGVFVHGESLLELAKRAFPRISRHFYAVHHGPLGLLDALPATPWEPGNCLFFGRMEAYKGLPEFVAVIRKLRADGVPVKGVIAGRGVELTRIKPELVDDVAFEVRDRFLPPAEVLDCFLRANVVVMPYRDATQSGIAAYAMGVGRPVVATNVGAIGELIVDGFSGLLVPPADSAALAAAIARVVRDDRLANQMAGHARELARENFSWQLIADQATDIYARMIADATRLS